jgi:glucose-1-phosphate thymidylyltransferase
MIAILLCAGFATRLYPLTKNFPKPLLPVAGRPAIDYLIDQVTDLPGIESIHVVTNTSFINHFVEWRDKWLPDIERHDLTLNLHNDGSTDNDNRLGAVADLAFVLRSLEITTGALVAAGDNIFRFSLKPLWQQFLDNDRNYLLALPENDPYRIKRTGVLELGPDDRVVRFHEKPKDPPSSWTCPAIYFLKPSALSRVDEYLALPDARDAPGYFISYLVTREPVYAIKVMGKSIDIGTIESYEEANAIFTKEPVFLNNQE